MRKAIAAGKVFGPARFGWTRVDGGRQHNVPLIVEFYMAWNSGAPVHEMSSRFGIAGSTVRAAIGAKSQRPIVGDELWLRAQQRPKGLRSPRSDARHGNPFRALLLCPWDGSLLQQDSHTYWHYFCPTERFNGTHHGWRGLSARRYVLPGVRAVLDSMFMPAEEAALAEAAQAPAQMARLRDFAGERDRLTMAWVRGNLTQERYDKALAELDASEQQAAVPLPPPEERVEILRELAWIDCTDRSKEYVGIVNRLMREALTFEVHEDRSVTVGLASGYAHWERGQLLRFTA